jgi:D-alanyl-lipoteichoic acid acyltransferase DltB (MBOAT superfamily)
MLFNTFQFLIFLVVVWTLYAASPGRWSLWVLCLASYYFYMCWNPYYVVLILNCVVVNYVAAIVIDRSSSRRARGSALAASLVLSLGTLFVYKYLDFAIGAFNDAAEWAGRPSWKAELHRLALPVGISFFTFQTLSYTIDVFRRRLRAETDFVRAATFVAFFPQLVAGPIERASSLLPQIGPKHPVRYENFQAALPLILWGLFKKVVVADSISVVVDTAYDAPKSYSGPILALATFFFAIQIYCDFSGYSDIAIGVARLFGIRLMTNFRQPYLARSISDFWQRWHISLTTWFRDYVYIPLGGNRVGRLRWAGNVLVVFLLSGMWHGANWTFLVWGALHSLYFFGQRFAAPPIYKVVNALKLHRAPWLLASCEWLLTMALVYVGWIFFRAASVEQAKDVLKGLFDASGFRWADVFRLGLPRFELAASAVWIGALFAVDGLLEKRPKWAMTLWENSWVRLALHQALVFAIVFFAKLEGVAFIYFQF